MKKKLVGLCHGVFDNLHYGHVLHFKKAKKAVHKLIVSVTADNYVNKGNNRPFFKINDRVNFIKSLSCVDEVIISDSKNALKSLSIHKPDYYFKGKEYLSDNNSKNKSNNTNDFNLEKNFCKKKKIKIIYTDDKVFSSSKILNNTHLSDPKLKLFLKKIRKKYNLSDIFNIINECQKKKITVIGDPIIDNYNFVSTVGVASKSPSIAAVIKKRENYNGGAIAVAETLSSLGFKINLISFKSRSKNIVLKNKFNYLSAFSSNEFPQVTRFLDYDRNLLKLLQIYNLKKIKLTKKNENSVIELIKKNLDSFFLVIDFDFGFLNSKISSYIDKKTNYSLNNHINSLNIITNHFSKFKNFKLITFNKREFDINFRRFQNDKEKINNARTVLKAPFVITMGKDGSIFYDKRVKNTNDVICPSIYQNILDPIGCGDAFFAVFSVFFNYTKDSELSSLLANVCAGLHGNFIGNKDFVSLNSLKNSLKTILS